MAVAKTKELTQEVLEAVSRLRRAAAAESDAKRQAVATSLANTFEALESRAGIRAAAKNALRLYRGGMGSFQDVGSAGMRDAVEGLRRALRHAARWW